MLFSVLPVLIRSKSGWELTYALLDTASESTLIQADLATQLELQDRDSHVKLMTIHGQDPDFGTRATSFTITSLDHLVTYEVERALIMAKLNVSDRKLNWPKEKMRWEHLKQLPVGAVDSTLIKILIGMDIVDAHLPLEVRRPPLNVTGPYGLRTPLGWSIVGKVEGMSVGGENVGSLASAVVNLELERILIENFWSTESFGTQLQVKPLIPKSELAALKIFEATVKNIGERYEIGLPWKTPKTPLPNNYTAARQMLIYFGKSVSKKEATRQIRPRYGRLLTSRPHQAGDEEELQMEKETGVERWYVTHHHVIHPQKPDKLRIVFNLSAKHRGVSLSDKRLKVPDFFPNLVGVLLRFRRNLIAVSADIEKMFLQVRVREEDQRYRGVSFGETTLRKKLRRIK